LSDRERESDGAKYESKVGERERDMARVMGLLCG
jgi:hypothetical protein